MTIVNYFGRGSALKNKNKSNIIIVAVFIIFYFFGYMMIVMLNDISQDSILFMGGEIQIASISGIIASLQMMISVTLSGINLRFARISAHLLPLFSAISTTLYIMRSSNPTAIPGVTMQIVCFIAVIIIHGLIKRREEDALTDYLTGAHNRRSITNNLERMVKSGKPFSIMYVDIDEFKFINDNYGHKIGDRVIKIVASRISELTDSKTIFGRIGGDEYILLVPGDISVSEKLSGEILDAVKKEIYIGDTNTCHYLTASIGISRFPKDSKISSELIRYADIAMYSVKTAGKNGIKFFEKELETEMMRISNIESLAQKYISEESFTFAYQPQYCAKTKKLRGFETLLRIREEDRNIVSTQELISVAEKSDIIFRIDEYVLRKALEEFKPNIQKYSDIILSVNVSAKHISKKGFPLAVEHILSETGFPAEQLEIEITEYCLAGSVDTTIQNMNNLRKLGIKIALDDFGTGYASLSYLSRLPVNLLKIDKSFIDRLSDSSSVDFISAIISMGHILGCEVISEGIESQAQLDIVTEKNCDFIQGFLWGAPLDIKMASELCEKICR